MTHFKNKNKFKAKSSKKNGKDKKNSKNKKKYKDKKDKKNKSTKKDLKSAYKPKLVTTLNKSGTAKRKSGGCPYCPYQD